MEEDKKISLSIMSPFVILMMQSFILYYFNMLGTSTGAALQLMSKIIVALLFLYSLSAVLKRSSFLFIFIYSLSIVIFLLNYLFFPQNRLHLMEVIFKYFFISLPCFIYSLSIRDMQVFKSIREKSCLIIYIIGVIIGILVFTNRIEIDTYSMSLGYYLLLPTVMYINNFFDKISIKDGFLALISIFIVVAIGSRGPIMCIGVYVVLYEIINFKNIDVRKLLFNTFFFMLTLLCIMLLDKILLVLNYALSKFGIYSRSIMLFLQDKVSLSGRENIYKTIFTEIKLHPIIGIGIAGDRRFAGTYSHNILLEILSGFGVIIGSLIMIFITIITIKALFSKDLKSLNEILIWITVGFLPLFISGSYLIEFPFWIFLGLTLGFLHRSNKNPIKISKSSLDKNNIDLEEK